MISTIIDIFSYTFMQRALVVGLLISVCAAILGVPLVLKKNSMIGDGLSHVGFGALAIATVMGFEPLYFTLPVVMICSFGILKLNENNKIHGDSAIALIASSALAIGIAVISIKGGVNTDINSYLFGSILAVSSGDVVLSIVLTILIIILFIFSYNKIFALTFDESFAKATGVNTNLYNILLAVICSFIIVLGMQIMGALLITSLIIFPSITSMQIFKNFQTVIIFSALIGALSFFIGLLISFFYSSPTGASIVLVNLFLLIMTKICLFIKNNYI